MIVMSVGVHHHHLLRHRPYLFLYTFQVSCKCPVRPDLRCRRCADMIIMMTAGDAEDAS